MRARDLHVAGYVLEAGQRDHFVHQARSPLVDFIQVHALQSELVESRATLRAADVDGRRILHERLDAGHFGNLGAEILDNVVYREAALVAWFHAGEEEAGVPGGKKRSHTGDVGMGPYDFRYLMLVGSHGVERDVLGSANGSHEKAAVRAGNEAGGHIQEEIDGAREHGERRHQSGETEAHGSVQRNLIGLRHSVEAGFQGVVDETVALFVGTVEETAAEHRSKSERYETRDQNGYDDGDRKLMQQAADNAAEEQHRNEDGNQRDSHGDDGEADLPRGHIGGLHSRLAHFHVADDVLQHDNGVIHNKADRQRQRHQRKVVEAVAQQVHHSERADDGERHGSARNHGGGDVSQEQEDDQHDQTNGQDKSEFHIADGVADGFRHVVGNFEMNGGRHFAAELRHQRANRIHHLNCIGPGLFLYGNEYAADVVVPCSRFLVFDAIDHSAQLLEADRSSVAISDDERTVGGGVGQHTVRLQGECLAVPIQTAGGKIGISGLDGALHLIDADVALG